MDIHSSAQYQLSKWVSGVFIYRKVCIKRRSDKERQIVDIYNGHFSSEAEFANYFPHRLCVCLGPCVCVCSPEWCVCVYVCVCAHLSAAGMMSERLTSGSISIA